MNSFEKNLVEALRSGEYLQVEKQLRSGNKYCCLGVACNLYDRSLWEDDMYLNAFSFLPDEVRYALGWSDDEGNLLIEDRDYNYLSLVILNDSGFTFSQIADVIEAGLVAKM